MRRECREQFPCRRLQMKQLVSDPDMHHGTCVRHVPWCMSGSLTRGRGENVPGIPGACATRNFSYLARGPLATYFVEDYRTSITFPKNVYIRSTLLVLHRMENVTYGSRDKMVAIAETIFTNAFSWIKMYKFRLRFHWKLFSRVQLTISQHWFR